MDNLVPEGYEILKLLKNFSERGSNQLRYQIIY